MRITITTGDDEFASVEVNDDMSLADLLALAQVEAQSLSSVDTDALQVFFNGKPLSDKKKSLKDHNIANEDLLMIMAMPTSSASSTRLSQSMSMDQQIEAAVTEYIEKYHSDPKVRSLLDRAPDLANSCKDRNRDGVREVLLDMQRRQKEAVELEHRLATSDPNDAEAQKLIYERIRKDRIDTMYNHAMEHTPEVFGQVHMLYIDTKINGQPVKVFVDCGAQTTIMSQACAERCNLTNVIDERFAGQAVGVGVQKIVGRIHWAQLQIGSIYMHISFSVLEDQTMDVLLGLDMLKRHQCCIDLRKGVLRIGSHEDFETPFLSEHQLPAHARFGALLPFGQSTSTEEANGPTDPKVRKLMKDTGCSDAELVEAQLTRAKGDEELAKTFILIKNIKK